MSRHFELITAPLRDMEQSVATAQVSFPRARDFSVEVATAVRDLFDIEKTTFDGKTLAVHVRRRGSSPIPVRFSAMVTCNTDDGIHQCQDLRDAYWPPLDEQLFVPAKSNENKHRPQLPLFLTPDGNWNLFGLQVFVTHTGEPLTAVFDGASASTGPAHYIPFEAPIRTDTPRDKLGREWVHFTGAREDLNRAGFDLLDGDGAACIPDPPDIRIRRLSGVMGVELVQLVSGDRRAIVATTDKLRSVVAKTPPSSLTHLRNQLVLVGFDTPTGRPPRDLEPLEFEMLVNRLAGRETRAVAYSDTADLRDGYNVRITNQPPGFQSVGLFPLPTTPRTPLGRSHGFELAASYTLVKPHRLIAAELEQLIVAKDQPGNDILLISAGAPSFGVSLLSDEALVERQRLEFMTFPKTKHLKRVLLHRWTNGDVYELVPELRCLVTPMRHPSEGGVGVVTPRTISEPVWSGPCPCGTTTQFRDCHGAV